MGDLLELQVLLLLRRGAEVEGIQAEVARFPAAALEHLDHGDAVDDLGEGEPEEELPHRARLDEGVVGRHRRESLVGLGGGVNSQAQVDGGEADDGHLAEPSVLELGLAEEVHREEIGEPERVEAEVADVAREVGRVLEEREGFAGNVRRGGGFGGLGCGILEQLRRGAAW